MDMSSKYRSILLVGDLPPPAHGQSVLFEILCRELPNRGFDCRVVDLGRKRSSPWSKVSVIRSMEICGALVQFVIGLAKCYRRVYILIAQSRLGFIRDMLMIWSAWLCGCRIVVHLHGGNYGEFYRVQPKLWQFLIRHTLRRVHRIIILSQRLRDMYAFDSSLQERIVVVMNCPSEELKGRPRHRDRQMDRVVRLLYLSNLIQSKGYFDVLEAVSILKRTTSMRLEAIFAGCFFSSPDDERTMLPEEAQALFFKRVEAENLLDVVRYLGSVSGEEKRHLLDISDFLLLPTNYINEGQPISIIEAMSYGCVVIATDFRSIPDLVVHRETGILIDYGRPEQIADAIRWIVTDAGKYTTMSRAAVERYEQKFTIDRHLDAMVSVLETI